MPAAIYRAAYLLALAKGKGWLANEREPKIVVK
jgi:hypothetical protein